MNAEFPSISVNLLEEAVRSDRLADAAQLPHDQVCCVDQVDSTNRALMDQPDATDPSVTRVLVAATQTAGRGRRGRSWLGDAPNCLAMSICLHRQGRGRAKPLLGLPIALGVALAQSLQPAAGRVGLKWPNDLYREGRKVAGMLVETRAVGDLERIVIGVGLNWAPAPQFADLLPQAGGLFDMLPSLEARERLAGEIARALINATQAFISSGLADSLERWAAFDVLAGREVLVFEGQNAVWSGLADGLAPDGSLRILVDGTLRLLASAEVSVRDASDPGRPVVMESNQ